MGIGIDDIKQKCLLCGYECSGRRSLGNHVARSHKEIGGLKGYVDRFIINEQPKCMCGCGLQVSWKKTAYHYADYISGHNDVGFRVKQPTFTREQVENRNNAIRRAYKERRNEITDKISRAIKQTFATHEGKQNLSKARKKMWAVPSMKKQLSAIRKKTWNEQHDELVEKIFTREMRSKISQANMNRDVKKTSKRELEIIQRIKQFFPALEVSKWFNFSEKVWCVDAWLSETQTMVEIDGTYWHGLDRISDFTLEQIKSISNDIKKNRIAIDKGLNLIRISDDIDVDEIVSRDSLSDLAYHLVEQGNVIKEGTFKIDERDPIISRAKLITMNDSQKKTSVLPLLESLFREHVKYHGWFYPEQTKTLTSAISSLRSLTPDSIVDRTSSIWLKNTSRSYWNVDNGPVKSIDTRALTSVLKYRLGLNNSKMYTYKDIDGNDVTTHETFDINLSSIRKGFIVQRHCVSWFQPALAYQVYRKHLEGIERPVVWDPSIGFSARMLGFAAACPKGTYIGSDPATMMFADAESIAEQLIENNSELSIDIHNVGSELFNELNDQSVDLVFTSPPYFDKEKYVDESGQCWRDHPTIESWVADYLIPTFNTASLCLKMSGKFILNIDESIIELVIATAEMCNLKHVLTEQITHTRDHFSKKRQSEHKEFLVTFERRSKNAQKIPSNML